MNAAVLAKQLEEKWKNGRKRGQGAKDAIPAEEKASAVATRKESAETAGGTSDAKDCEACGGTGKVKAETA